MLRQDDLQREVGHQQEEKYDNQSLRQAAVIAAVCWFIYFLAKGVAG